MPGSIASIVAALAGTAALVWAVVDERLAGRVPVVSLGARWFGRARTTPGAIAVALVAGLLFVLLPLLASPSRPWRLTDAAIALPALAITVAVKLLFVAFEEIIFRGALLDRLRRSLGATTAVVASALVFALAHASRSGDTAHVPVVLTTFVDGLGYGAAAVVTGSLWTPAAWHAAKNLAVWQLTGTSTLQFAPGTFAASGAQGAAPGDAAWAALVVVLAVPALRALARPAPSDGA